MLLCIFTVPVVATTYLADWLIQARLLYLFPFQLSAAIALGTFINEDLIQRRNMTQTPFQTHAIIKPISSPVIYDRIFVITVSIWLVSMAIKELANLPPYT
jgi:hypothetical protein